MPLISKAENQQQSDLSWLPSEWRKPAHAGQKQYTPINHQELTHRSSPPQPQSFPIKTNGRAKGKGRERKKLLNASTGSHSFYLRKQALRFAEVISLGQDLSRASKSGFCFCAFHVYNDLPKKQAFKDKYSWLYIINSLMRELDKLNC